MNSVFSTMTLTHFVYDCVPKNQAESVLTSGPVHSVDLAKLGFPGGMTFHEKFDILTEFCVWAATVSSARNQVFDVVNGNIESWLNLWPKLAEHYGLRRVSVDQSACPTPDASYIPMANNRQLSVEAVTMAVCNPGTMLQVCCCRWQVELPGKRAPPPDGASPS